ncbi:MAG: hypothetical protein ABL932_12690 [Terricaulis sp.]
MLRRAVCAAAIVWAGPAAAQIVVTSDGYDAFSGATYIEDHDSNIVLTEIREMGFSGVDIRGLRDPDGQWRVEYFCRPDTVLIAESGRRRQTYYLPYLSWSSANYVTDDVAIVESRRVPSMGTFGSLLPESVPSPSPEADITVRHQLRRGARVVESLVTITNRARSAQHMTYIYQDAAYMWFPEGDQKNTESIRLSVSPGVVQRQVNASSSGPTPAGYWQFAGTFNRHRGVVAGILSMTPGEIAGISGNYVGVSPTEIEGQGYYRARRDFGSDDIPIEQRGEGVRDMRFVNRFVALDFGSLEPGETRTLPFLRIMGVLPPDQHSDEDIEAWIRAEVTRIYEDAAAPVATQSAETQTPAISIGEGTAGH